MYLESTLRPLIIMFKVALYMNKFLCNANYVGSTARHLHQRISEHCYSAIGKHLQTQHDNKRAKIGHLFKALKKCRSKFDCLIYEMLFTKDNQALSQHPK